MLDNPNFREIVFIAEKKTPIDNVNFMSLEKIYQNLNLS